MHKRTHHTAFSSCRFGREWPKLLRHCLLVSKRVPGETALIRESRHGLWSSSPVPSNHQHLLHQHLLHQHLPWLRRLWPRNYAQKDSIQNSRDHKCLTIESATPINVKIDGPKLKEFSMVAVARFSLFVKACSESLRSM